MENKNLKTVIAPINGKVISLDEVPDPVFSDRVLGDGCAIIPEDGKIYSPVNGKISSIADTFHAYGIESDDGLEILIHFGLETVSLKGQGFTPHVKVGDKVKVGDLIAEVDIKLLKSNNINLITPVLICDGIENKAMTINEGMVKAGKIAILSVEDPEIENSEKDNNNLNENVSSESKKKKHSLNFDCLQKLGKVLMVVIAVMPAAGLMISLGKLIAMASGDIQLVMTIGSIMENIGWAIINNLHILFAIAIGGSWAKEKAGGAFAAVIAFILINSITGAIFGVTNDMLNDPNAITHTLFGQEIEVNGYFTSVLGAPALNMGVFVGIISGFVGGIIYN
ncbi:MAG: glucose PTS transporter subunit IIA, partial [Oscillospiraceae bacterium]|nr:glucose PTS transporter subunit IIA [Oscillospiraceae bacterium]